MAATETVLQSACNTAHNMTQPGQLTPTDQRDLPDHMTQCSAIKAGGKKEEEGTFGVTAFVFPSNCYA